MAFVGIIVSTVVATVVSAYLDIWSKERPPPGAPRLSASAEVWWDLTSDERVVIAPKTAVDRRGAPYEDSAAKSFMPAGPMGAMDLIVEENGINAGVMRVGLILNNFTQVPASVTEVRVQVVGEREVPSGRVYRCGGPQGGADLSRVKLDLARPELPAQEFGDDGEVVGQYPSARLQVAAQGDPAHFNVKISAGKVAYDFVLQVSYEQAGQKHQVTVDQAGRHFSLAPDVSKDLPFVRCDIATGTWKEHTQ
ncbi:hypothetical protein AB0N79_37135 [Streptomyces microflavus]|uniref:hypothetical protein n=1 Tax=Streptomyces microflavus TaxID=1919 RepID=UPI003444D866